MLLKALRKLVPKLDEVEGSELCHDGDTKFGNLIWCGDLLSVFEKCGYRAA